MQNGIREDGIEHERARARVTYLAESVDIRQLEIVSGPARIDLTAKYDHSAGNLEEGKLQFRLNSSRIDLARVRNLQKARPGLGGTVTVAASGSATVRQGENRVLFQALDANLAATGIAARGKNFGDLTLTAKTKDAELKLLDHQRDFTGPERESILDRADIVR